MYSSVKQLRCAQATELKDKAHGVTSSAILLLDRIIEIAKDDPFMDTNVGALTSAKECMEEAVKQLELAESNLLRLHNIAFGVSENGERDVIRQSTPIA